MDRQTIEDLSRYACRAYGWSYQPGSARLNDIGQLFVGGYYAASISSADSNRIIFNRTSHKLQRIVTIEEARAAC